MTIFHENVISEYRYKPVILGILEINNRLFRAYATQHASNVRPLPFKALKIRQKTRETMTLRCSDEVQHR